MSDEKKGNKDEPTVVDKEQSSGEKKKDFSLFEKKLKLLENAENSAKKTLNLSRLNYRRARDERADALNEIQASVSPYIEEVRLELDVSGEPYNTQILYRGAWNRVKTKGQKFALMYMMKVIEERKKKFQSRGDNS